MQTGSEVGALLVDGLGDGIAVACPSQDLNFLRNMSFGVLQGSRMRNTKTGDLILHLLLFSDTPYASSAALVLPSTLAFRLAQTHVLCARCLTSQYSDACPPLSKISIVHVVQDCVVKHAS